MDTSKSGAVVAIGNFDGVHRGHAALIAHAKKIAQASGMPLKVLTFEPHPRDFFKPNSKPFRLTPEHLKDARLKACGADSVEVLDFNSIMANLSAQQFMDIILDGSFDAKHIVVGPDFHFGHNRTGTLDTLKADGRFTVHTLDLEAEGAEVISSTRIRKALEAGEIEVANKLLGWNWSIEGTVIHGDKRGRELGYPTANIPLGDTLVPAHGIYAVRVDIGDSIWRKGAASIGLRPMFAVSKPLLEVFIFDFEGDLYDRTLNVQPVRKLRDEAKFENIEALKIQMAKDVEQAKSIIS